ncbi:MAG: AAA family ATPase, partial [Stenotrophomonas sp.]
FAKLTEGSQEAQTVRFADASATGEGAGEDADAVPGEAKGGLSKTPALDQFTTNLTQRARDGKIDPVIGRDAEIRQVIDILMRRRQNNPILTGEAGVGKTAVVEGLARRIAEKDVPDVLQGVELHTLDMGLLQAGASVKGEFENRLKNVIDEVKKSPHPIILFIDEAHTMIGAGGSAGQNDAANLLKPALARGELRTIAATTWSEYKKYFEKDAALARRFQVVKVEEPSEVLAAAMLRGMVSLMEAHFGIRVLDEAVTEAVRLSHRYISGRQLPDKAVSVLDTACAKVALGQSATPAIIEDTRKHLDRLEAELAALQRETAGGSTLHEERLAELKAQQ